MFLLRTPPFSSEEEADEDDIEQSYISPELLKKQSKTSSNKVSAFQKASGKSDINGMEESEIEETGTPAKTSKGFFTTFVYACCNSYAWFCISWSISVLENIMKADYLVSSIYLCALYGFANVFILI